MDEKQQLLNDITAKVKAELSTYASKGDLEIALKAATTELKEQFKGMNDLETKLASIEKAAIAQGEMLSKMKNSEPAKPMSIKSQLEAQSAVIKSIIDNPKLNANQFKTVVLPTSITSNFNGQIIPGIGQYPQRSTKIVDIWNSGVLQANHQRTLRYMDTTTYTNNAAARTVGAQAGESAIAWTGYSLGIESISHWIPVALEMLSDFDFIESEINGTLISMLINKFEYYLMSGTGSPPQIYGINAKATAFDATNFAGKFKSAGTLDLIKAMSAKVAYDTRFQANYALMNTYDALALELEKDDFGRLIYPNFLSADGMRIGSITVIPTELVTADTMYVGDFNFGTLFKTAPQVSIGLNSTDFSERQVTLLANMDAALLIKTLNAGAFYKCASIANDVAEITKTQN